MKEKMACSIEEKRSSERLHFQVGSEPLNDSVQQVTMGLGVLDNETYNLMELLEAENKSLWRIKNSYKKDTDEDGKRLLSAIENEKEKIVALITEKVKNRL